MCGYFLRILLQTGDFGKEGFEIEELPEIHDKYPSLLLTGAVMDQREKISSHLFFFQSKRRNIFAISSADTLRIKEKSWRHFTAN